MHWSESVHYIYPQLFIRDPTFAIYSNNLVSRSQTAFFFYIGMGENGQIM